MGASAAPSGASIDESQAVIRADGNYFGTVRRRFVMAGLHMSETVYGAGARIPRHRHECPSFFMPLGGRFVEGCAGAVRGYGVGDVGYHPAYEPHWLHTQGGGACGFAVEVGDEWRQTCGANTVWDSVPRDLSQSRVAWALGRLYLELQMHDTARPLVVHSLGVEIGLALGATDSRRSTPPPRWLGTVRELLHDRVRESIALAELADVAGVTPVAVIKSFRRHLGCTPGEYLRTLRLSHARRELAQSDRPMSAIALDAGFYDQGHFSRAFKTAMGVPPSRYRRLLRGTAGR